MTRHTIGDLLSFNESTISIVGKNSTSLQLWITHSSMVTGLRDAILLNVYLNLTFELIQCIHAMSKSEKKAHNYPQAPYAKDREGNCLWHMGIEIIFRSCPTCQSTSTRYEGLKKASNVCACLLILNTVAFIRAVFHNNAHYTDVNGCTVTLTADHFRKIMSGKQPETLWYTLIGKWYVTAAW